VSLKASQSMASCGCPPTRSPVVAQLKLIAPIAAIHLETAEKVFTQKAELTIPKGSSSAIALSRSKACEPDVVSMSTYPSGRFPYTESAKAILAWRANAAAEPVPMLSALCLRHSRSIIEHGAPIPVDPYDLQG
jgi:hypothetical protein